MGTWAMDCSQDSGSLTNTQLPFPFSLASFWSTLNSSQGTLWILEIETQSAKCQANALPAVLWLGPAAFFPVS